MLTEGKLDPTDYDDHTEGIVDARDRRRAGRGGAGLSY